MVGASVDQWLYFPGRFGARVTYRLYGGWTFSNIEICLFSQDPDTVTHWPVSISAMHTAP